MKNILIFLSGLLVFAACAPSPEQVRRELDELEIENAFNADPEATEKTFGRWIELLEQLPADEAGERIDGFFRRLEEHPDRFLLGRELAEKYLYSPESPLRDDELYGCALQRIVESRHIGAYDKLRPRFQLNMVRRNRPGTPAADFALDCSDGTSKSLEELKSPLVLLVFATPDCPECRSLLGRLSRNGWIRMAEALGELRIAAVYSSPEERYDRWEEFCGELPDRWIKACDRGARLHYEGLYDLRSTPALYLLDAEKRVLVKGVPNLRPVTKRLRKELFRPRNRG